MIKGLGLIWTSKKMKATWSIYSKLEMGVE